VLNDYPRALARPPTQLHASHATFLDPSQATMSAAPAAPATPAAAAAPAATPASAPAAAAPATTEDSTVEEGHRVSFIPGLAGHVPGISHGLGGVVRCCTGSIPPATGRDRPPYTEEGVCNADASTGLHR
jgi:hypothetical protein